MVLISLLLVTGCISSQSNLTRGKQYLESRKYEQAISALEKAANEKGDIYYYIDTYSSLGEAYRQNGKTDSALSMYRNVLQIVNLRLRELSARRMYIRRSLNDGSSGMKDQLQREDIGIADEEWKLKEKKDSISNKIKQLTGPTQ